MEEYIVGPHASQLTQVFYNPRWDQIWLVETYDEANTIALISSGTIYNVSLKEFTKIKLIYIGEF